MTEIIEETEEQAAARILAWRCSKALAGAADLALHVRSLAINGKTERGETLPEWSAPMRITATDDVDSMFAQLVNWVGFWSETLNLAPPSTAIIAWSNMREVQGFRAGTTPEGAHHLVQLQAMWLNLREATIGAHESAEAYRTDVVQLLGALRSRYPLAPRPPRPISLRPCPVCVEAAVGAEWHSGELVDVEISCELCGWTPDSLRPSEIMRWLSTYAETTPSLSVACAGVHHGDCTSQNCSCPCHDWVSADVGRGESTPVRNAGRVLRMPSSTAAPDPRVCPVCHLYHPEGACQG